jgi:hypothetical protein
MSFYCGGPCGKRINAVPNADNPKRGTYECEDGHRYGGWVDHGKLDIGIEPLEGREVARNDLALFFEDFTGIESAGVSWFGQSGPCPSEEGS